jgi:hypothetical protein
MAIIWFLTDRCVSVRTGIPCDATEGFRDLPLPCPKALWEAQSRDAWASEYGAVYCDKEPRLSRFGDLVDAHSKYGDASAMKMIDKWNAGIDNLGSLLNLAVFLVS